MRRSRLAVCTLASDTPITKIEVSCSGEIKPISSQRSVKVRLLRKPMGSAARGSPTALSSASPTATALGVPHKNADKFGKGALDGFQKNGIWQINDVEHHNGIGRKEVVLDGAKCPTHSTTGGKKSKLITDARPESSYPKKLKRSRKAGTAHLPQAHRTGPARHPPPRCARCRSRFACSCR